MGGVESHCEELLPRIAAMAPDLAIEVLARQPYVGPGVRAFAGVQVTPLPSPRQRSSEAIVATVLGVLHARRRRASAVHIHAVGPGLAAPLARALGLKVIFTHHGADYDRAKWGRFAKLMLRAGERFGIRAADAIIAIAPSLEADLKRRFPGQAAAIRYIPNGASELPANGNPDEVLAKLGVTRGGYVLSVSRLVPEKGLHVLTEAFARSGHPGKLLIVGGADHESPYSRALLAKASENIIFAGVQARSVLKHLYSNAALFVLPSFHEGLPIVALEAGLAGCPMLLSDIQPNRDLGLQPQYYFRAGSPEALAEALARDPSGYAVDREFFRRRFDWNAIAAQTLGVYRAVLG
jgi:glycosyltransferase involved in cell wall biosynthesis